MQENNKPQYSLEQKVFRASLFTCLFLGMTALVVGLYLYYVSLTRQQVSVIPKGDAERVPSFSSVYRL